MGPRQWEDSFPDHGAAHHAFPRSLRSHLRSLLTATAVPSTPSQDRPAAEFAGKTFATRAAHNRPRLKAGIYSTPWITSYAKFAGGSSDDAKGTWTKELAERKFQRFGKYSFAVNDVKQWAAWGFDYLKYNWSPIDVPHVEEMSRALWYSGRDIVFSLSNSASFEHAADRARLANCWRTTGDIWDR